MITLKHKIGGPPPPTYVKSSEADLLAELARLMTSPLVLPENRPDVWVVGVGEIPSWVTEVKDYALSMDDHGNAYFQFVDRAVIVGRGSMVYKDEDTIVFGERWGING